MSDSSTQQSLSPAVTPSAVGGTSAAGSLPSRQPQHLQRQQQQQQQQQQQPPRQLRIGSGNISSRDEAARAAMKMAAVAQAANSGNKSPQEVAEIARANAQNIAKKQSPPQNPQQLRQQHLRQQQQMHRAPSVRPEPRKIQPVPLESVKSLLLTEIAANKESENQNDSLTYSKLLEKLARGENDSLMQQLLLMEYHKGETTQTDVSKEDQQEGEDGKSENWKTTFACERVKFLLKQIETAYESMESLLPPIERTPSYGTANVDASDATNASFGSDDYGVDDDMDSPVSVLDFLPPCTSKGGDNTLEFFKACSGKLLGGEKNAKDGSPDLAAVAMGSEDSQKEDGDGKSLAFSASEATLSTDASSNTAASSMFSGVFGGIKRNSLRGARPGFLASISRRGRRGSKMLDEATSDRDNEFLGLLHKCKPGEYCVIIEREMLGLTVENVLERTVVRTVLETGPAKKAGAKVGSLIVKVGNIETKNLTHFETIDELRQSQRPLVLVLRQIPEEALKAAREEMGRLIRGSGFGKVIDGEGGPSFPGTNNANPNSSLPLSPNRPSVADDDPESQASIKKIGTYSGLIRKRWIEAVNLTPRSKKCEPILRVGEKLLWIMTLFVIGLEREAERLSALNKENPSISSALSPRNAYSQNSQYNHSSKDYADAAKSASKVLFEFVRNRMDPSRVTQNTPPPPPAYGGRGRGHMGGRGGRGGRGRGGRGMHIPGMNPPPPVLSSDKLLAQIGEVLQRMMTFLADTTSPPAAMLRGELIACLCDILDADTEMKLSEEDSMSSTQGEGTGPIADLGSAGSLLKLIILNCTVMRSMECERQMRKTPKETGETKDDDLALTLHAGNRFLAVVHRLAASRSTSARITACSLGPVLWSRLDFPHQLQVCFFYVNLYYPVDHLIISIDLCAYMVFEFETNYLQLRGVITRALHDVEVIVRKSTATVLHEIAELVYDSRCVPWLVLMCERAMTDPEPQLRSAAMTLTWHLAEHLPNAFVGDASKGSRYLRRLPSREDPIFADVYLLQCKLLPVATRLAEDRAPHVRLAVAAQCERLCDALGDHWSSVIIDVLVALLTDSDERVRGEAVLCVPRLADIVLLSSPPGVIPAGESSVLDALLPAAIKLQKDPSSSVRIALATTAGEMLTLLVGLQRSGEVPVKEQPGGYGPRSIRYEKRHVDDRLIPLVQRLLEDTDPEVTSSALRAVTNASRSAAKDVPRRYDTDDDDTASIASVQSQTTQTTTSSVGNKPVFLPVLSEEQVLRLLPTLSELSNSKQWRVRQSAVEIVPALLGCTDKFEIRADIAHMCMRLTKDRVDAVRKTAAECLCLGGTGLGSHGDDVSGEWITALVIPQIQSCAKDIDYRQRLLCLKMVEVILINSVCPSKWKNESANAEGKNTPLRELLKLTLSLADDPIANVRLNVGRVLSTVVNEFGEDECRVIKYAMLQQMKKEKSIEKRRDRDVNFYATKCLDRVRLKVHGDADSPAEI